VVGVDTGLLHLAAAYRVPLVAVFTASDPALTGPVGGGPIRVVGGANARPEVNEVIAAVAAVLGE
jgi:heptosyltransferase-1